jgi:hypothetical protein
LSGPGCAGETATPIEGGRSWLDVRSVIVDSLLIGDWGLLIESRTS